MEPNAHKEEGIITDYKNGDVYLNSVFGDLWIVKGTKLIKINYGYEIDID